MNLTDILRGDRPIPADVTYTDVRPVFRWVYAWMFVGLIVTSVVAFITASTPAILELAMNPTVLIIALVAQFVLVIALSWALPRISPGLAAALFVLYAGLLGFTLSFVLLVFDLGSVGIAFGTTAVLFAVMTMFAFTTDLDLTRYGNLFLIGLIGLIVVGVINFFIQSSALEFLYSIVGVVLFMGLVAYDTQKIKRMASAPEVLADGSMTSRIAIYGALGLYLNFVNIFLFLLRLMGGGRD